MNNTLNDDLAFDEHWVDTVLLAGAGNDPCLWLGRDIDRSTLRLEITRFENLLADAGLQARGTVALRLPPSLGYVSALLASWRLGAQVILIDYRLTQAETRRVIEQLAPQIVVENTNPKASGLRGYIDVEPAITIRVAGLPARTHHALIQLSSGSTGPSKVIARTFEDLGNELDRYDRLTEFVRPGERIVLLSSMVHVLGLVGALLYGLHAHAEVVLPERMTAAGIIDAVSLRDHPTTIIGVPFYAELLAGAGPNRPPAGLVRMIVAGELLRPGMARAFTETFGVPLGTMYGMTEVGVIATDLSGQLQPALEPTHGMELHILDGELHLRMPACPYLGVNDLSRWSDGWLHTRDAATFDSKTGHVVILGRRDSQVSVGGLKVDLTEVEQTLAATPGVTQAVVVFDNGGIEAYLVLEKDIELSTVSAHLANEMAAYKVPRHLRVLAALPRTATGKIVRNPGELQAELARHLGIETSANRPASQGVSA